MKKAHDEFVEQTRKAVDATGDSEKAIRRLVKWLSADSAREAELLDNYRRCFAEQAVHAQYRRLNEQAFNATKKSGLSPPKVRRGSGAALLLNYRINGGLRIRHAKRPDLSEAISLNRGRATVYGKKADWLERVCARLPDDDTPVGKVLDEAALRALQ